MRIKGQFTRGIISHLWTWGSYLRSNCHWTKQDEKEITDNQNNPMFLKGFACGLAMGWNNCLDEIKKSHSK